MDWVRSGSGGLYACASPHMPITTLGRQHCSDGGDHLATIEHCRYDRLNINRIAMLAVQILRSTIWSTEVV